MKPCYLRPCVAAFASLFSMAALAAPTPLPDQDLERITAGSSHEPAPNGGAIVGNGAVATLLSSGEVALEDGAQAEAAALNLVNSSESTVANGVNVFDGRVDQDAALEGAKTVVEQGNTIAQDQRRLSSLPSYERGANTTSEFSDAGTSASSSSSSIVDQVMDLERTFITDSATTVGSYDRSGAPTVLIDAQLDGVGSYLAEFNAPSASNSVGVVFNGEINIAVDGGGIEAVLERVTDVEDETEPRSGLDLGLTIDMPTLDLEFDAMGCVAVNGNCSIDGSRTETTDVISDHSLYYSADESAETDTSWDRSGSESVNAAFSLSDAQAEYIVVDESQLDVSASYLVALSGGAQAGLRAMNVVNAAGSAVANGVNVATQRTGGSRESAAPSFSLTQFNHIVHSR